MVVIGRETDNDREIARRFWGFEFLVSTFLVVKFQFIVAFGFE